MMICFQGIWFRFIGSVKNECRGATECLSIYPNMLAFVNIHSELPMLAQISS